MNSDRWLVLGLGNPGDQYASTRHNIGQMVIDYLASDVKFSNHKSKTQIADIRVAGKSVVLAKTLSYMNESGAPTKALADFYKVAPANLIVIHDELDISVIDDNQAKKIVEIMEGAVTLAIPNKVDYESGETWGDIYA